MYSTRAGTQIVDLVVALDMVKGLEKFCVSSTTMVIKTELWTGVHSLWLEQLTADQQVRGSIPGGGRGLSS